MKILLIMECVGTGDIISALPALHTLSQEHSVTVYGRPFFRSLYERAGCSFLTAAGQTRSEAFTRHFDKTYWLAEWSSIREMEVGYFGSRIEYFASLVETTLPETFNFAEYLLPEKAESDYYVLAGQAVEHWRSLPIEKENEIYRLLSEVTTTVRLPKVYIYTDRVVGSDMKLQELINLVANARAVVSVDTGTLHIACALGVPSIGLFGITSSAIMEQYRKYVPNFAHTAIAGSPVDWNGGTCSLPCHRNHKNGFDGQCGFRYDDPQCLATLDSNKIMEAVNA